MTIPAHRLAAIIFTDISGYTSLMGENEVKAMNIMKLNQEIHHQNFKKFNCVYYKQMGDGFMAVFNSLSEAIYASAHILEATKKEDIKLRVGIHEGDVIFQDNDVYGDGVNIAARLEQASQPGSIYVSESVKRNLENKPGISSSFVKEATLKNIKNPLKIYEIDVANQLLPDSLPESFDYRKAKNIAPWKIVAFVVVLISLGLFVFKSDLIPDFNSSSKITKDIQLPGNSIAVLPFENQGNSDDFDYLGTGFADGILTKLSMLNDFVIISRPSSFKFKGSGKSLAEIAEQLGVNMILEGSYQVIENKIRINAKLVGVKENSILLAQTYNGKVEDIFKLQDLASEGLFKLLGKTEIISSFEKSSTKYPPSMEAYKHYQEGLSLIKQDYVYKSDIEESRILLQMALEEDPSYIDPLIALAESFFLEIFYGYNSIYFVKDSIEEYISRANQINPDIGQLLTMKGAINYYEYNLNEARKLINKGIELNPNYPFNYYFLSFISIYSVDRGAQLKHINTAIDLDPLNNSFQSAKIIQCIFLSDFNTAESMINASLQKQPGNNMALFLKGMMLCQQKKYQKALDILLMRSVGDTTNFLIAYTQGKVGNTAMAVKITNLLIEREKRYFVSPTTIAVAYLGLGEYEKVLQWTEKAFVEKDGWSNWLLFTMFEPLHEDERFIELLKKFDIYSSYQILYNKSDKR